MMPPICPNCCTDPCTIVTVNPFADLSAFTQIGTVTIDAGAAVLESGEGLVTVAEPTNFYDPVILTVTAETAETSGTLRLAVARLDADNYLFGEYDFAGTTGTLRLGIREAASEDWLTDAVEVEDTADLGDSTTFSLCWVPGEVQEGGQFEVDCEAEVKSASGSWDDPPTFYILAANVSAPPVNAAAFPCLLIPPGSTIDEITISVPASLDTSADVRLLEITIAVGGAVVGTLTPNVAVTTGPVGDGGTLADWGADGDITWENIQFLSTSLTFRGGADADGVQLSIGDVTVNVTFTTPDVLPGRLTFSRNNVTALTVDCARAFNVEVQGEGKSAAVLSVASQFEVSSFDYSYHYSETKTTCPQCDSCPEATEYPCSNCCDEGFPAAGEYILDLGVGGWENSGFGSECDQCEGVAGEYLIEFRPGAPGFCGGYYQEIWECEDGCTAIFIISLSLGIQGGETSLPPANPCVWSAQVYVSFFEPGCEIFLNESSFATYRSDPMDSKEDCQTLPVTLTKTNVGDNGAFARGPCRTGLLPNTITLEAVP